MCACVFCGCMLHLLYTIYNMMSGYKCIYRPCGHRKEGGSPAAKTRVACPWVLPEIISAKTDEETCMQSCFLDLKENSSAAAEHTRHGFCRNPERLNPSTQLQRSWIYCCLHAWRELSLCTCTCQHSWSSFLPNACMQKSTLPPGPHALGVKHGHSITELSNGTYFDLCFMTAKHRNIWEFPRIRNNNIIYI